MTFHHIYHTHKDLVYNLSLQYTQQVEDAEEITQDVFVAVHAKLSSFKRQSDIKTWLYRITINKSLDFLKAKKRKKRWSMFGMVNLDDDNQHLDLPEYNHPGIQLEQKEALEAIFSCINTLPDNQKTAIILLKIEGMSQAEAAVVMNISTKAIESLFQRAKKNLHKFLNPNEG